MKRTIKIGRRGSDLAFRIPKATVERFNLKVGDTIDSSIIEHALIRIKAEPKRKDA
jgi:antitoxin component of MazEF toxin-antitoxin module